MRRFAKCGAPRLAAAFTRRIRGAVTVVLALAAVTWTTGCREGDDAAAAPSAKAREAAPRVATARRSEAPAGPRVSVSGRVTFEGEPPPARMPAPTDRHCHDDVAVAAAEVVSIDNETGGLGNVVVYLKEPPSELNVASVAAPATTQPAAVLDQVKCQYVPRVLALRVGEVLRVTSSDPTLHNVHLMSRSNEPLNFGMSGKGAVRDLTFSAAEWFEVTCDVHPWMRASVCVFDHPYFAVTAADGSFAIEGVPPGAYTLVTRHELLGIREVEVEVAADGKPVADADVAYAPPRRKTQ